MDNFIKTLKADYVDGMFPFPKDDIPSSKKNREWFKKYCSAIFATYVKDESLIPYSRIEKMRMLRDFGNGCQSVERYKEIINEWDVDSPERITYVNLDYHIYSPIPKLKAIFLGIMNSYDYKASANTINPFAIKKREFVKYKILYQKEFAVELKNLDQKLGIKSKEPEYIPENRAELDMFDRLGGLRLVEELALEEITDHSFHTSNWKRIALKMNSDLYDFSWAFGRIYTDPDDNKVKARYVDPLHYIGQYSRNFDFTNQKYGAEIIPMKIHQIRKESQLDKDNPDITEDELRGLAVRFSGEAYGNPTLDNISYDDSYGEDGSIYDDFNIYVLDVAIKSTDKDVYVTRKNKNGEIIFTEEKSGKKYGKNSSKETDVIPFDVVYEGKFIIGTDHVFGFKKMNDIIKHKGKSIIPFFGTHLDGQSKTELCIGLENQIMLTFLNIQNLIAATAPPGLVVEYSSLMNMDIKGVKDPTDLLKIYNKKGSIIYKGTNARNNPNIAPGSSPPIREIGGNFEGRLNAQVSYIDWLIRQMGELTGINRVAAASDPNPEDTYKGNQLAIMSTTKALDPLHQCYLDLMLQAAIMISIRGKDLVSTNDKAYESYSNIIGEHKLKALKNSQDFEPIDIGIEIELMPTEEMKREMKQAAIQAFSSTRDGGPLITYGDYLFVNRMIDIGNIKFAELYLAAKEAKAIKERAKQVQENIMLQKKAEQETAKQKHEQDKELETHETDEKIRFEEAQTELKIKYEEEKARIEVRTQNKEKQESKV